MFNLPSTPVPGPHKDSLCKLCYLQDGSIVSCSQDGVVCFWTLGLKPKRIRRVNIIKEEEQDSSMNKNYHYDYFQVYYISYTYIHGGLYLITPFSLYNAGAPCT